MISQLDKGFFKLFVHLVGFKLRLLVICVRFVSVWCV